MDNKMHAKKLNEYSAAGNVSAGIELKSFLSVSDVQYSAPGDVSAGIDNTSAEDITPVLSVSDVQYSAAGDVSAGIDNTSAEDITHEKRSTEERMYSSSALSG